MESLTLMLNQIQQVIHNSNEDPLNSQKLDHQDFSRLNMEFVREYLPIGFSKSVINNLNSEGCKFSGELFIQIFKKHNLEMLVKKDNLIFQSLLIEKSFSQEKLNDLLTQKQQEILGMPVSRKDAVLVLKWMDKMIEQINMEKSNQNDDFDQKLDEIERERMDLIQLVLEIAWKEIIR